MTPQSLAGSPVHGILWATREAQLFVTDLWIKIFFFIVKLEQNPFVTAFVSWATNIWFFVIFYAFHSGVSHSTNLAWKIPWMKEPGRLQSKHSRTPLSDFTFTFHFHALEKEMAIHSSVLAWRIPGTAEPGGLQLCGVAQSWTRLKRLSSSS